MAQKRAPKGIHRPPILTADLLPNQFKVVTNEYNNNLGSLIKGFRRESMRQLFPLCWARV
eukprot:5963982-Amphidinium_carterae.1